MKVISMFPVFVKVFSEMEGRARVAEILSMCQRQNFYWLVWVARKFSHSQMLNFNMGLNWMFVFVLIKLP